MLALQECLCCDDSTQRSSSSVVAIRDTANPQTARIDASAWQTLEEGDYFIDMSVHWTAARKGGALVEQLRKKYNTLCKVRRPRRSRLLLHRGCATALRPTRTCRVQGSSQVMPVLRNGVQSQADGSTCIRTVKDGAEFSAGDIQRSLFLSVPECVPESVIVAPVRKYKNTFAPERAHGSLTKFVQAFSQDTGVEGI